MVILVSTPVPRKGPIMLHSNAMKAMLPSIVRITTCNSYGLWYPASHEHNCTLTGGN